MVANKKKKEAKAKEIGKLVVKGLSLFKVQQTVNV